MSAKIVISASRMQQMKTEIEAWLAANAGQGSARYGGRNDQIDHWLNGDDWLYYNQHPVGDAENLQEYGTVFLFKSSELATEFARRFS
jgi:hypothetical protein